MLAAISNPGIATSVRMLKIERIYRGREALGVSDGCSGVPLVCGRGLYLSSTGGLGLVMASFESFFKRYLTDKSAD